MLGLILALSGKNSSCLTFAFVKVVVVCSGYLQFPITAIGQNAYDLETDGFRGDALFRAKIIH